MASETFTVNIFVSSEPSNTDRNVLSIYLDDVVEELTEDEHGIVTYLDWYYGPLQSSSYIGLQPRSFTHDDITQLLHDQEVPRYQYLGQEISFRVNRALANDNSLQEPLEVTIYVEFLNERRFFMSQRGASEDVFQRLVEEQRVESTDLEDENEIICSICIDDLSENIIRMPRCLHLFHQGCLFEWLSRQNSCPLCRRVPYEEDTELGLGLELEFGLEELGFISIS